MSALAADTAIDLISRRTQKPGRILAVTALTLWLHAIRMRCLECRQFGAPAIDFNDALEVGHINSPATGVIDLRDKTEVRHRRPISKAEFTFEFAQHRFQLAKSIRNEVLHKWRQPKSLFFTIILCSIGAAVQSVSQHVPPLLHVLTRDKGLGSNWIQWSQFVLPSGLQH